MRLSSRTHPHILFDLDGTLADTLGDFEHVLNAMLRDRSRAPIALSLLRGVVTGGTDRMVEAAFGVTPGHREHAALREEFLSLYATHLSRHTQLFPGIPEVLDALDRDERRWGIVTNKHERFTSRVIEALALGLSLIHISEPTRPC